MRERVDGVGACEYPLLAGVGYGSLRPVFQLHPVDEGPNALLLRCVLRKAKRKRMFRSQNYKGRPEERVLTGSEDRQRLFSLGEREAHLRPDALADPVALHHLDRLRPSGELIQAAQQLLSVGGDPEEPSRQFLLNYRCPVPPAEPPLYLLISQYGLAGLTPVDG